MSPGDDEVKVDQPRLVIKRPLVHTDGFQTFQAKKRSLIEAGCEDARRHLYKDDDLALVGEDEFHEVEEGPSEKKFVPNSAPPPPPITAASQSSAS